MFSLLINDPKVIIFLLFEIFLNLLFICIYVASM